MLHKYQEAFFEAIFENKPEALESIFRKSEDANDRFRIYSNNVFASLKNVIHDDFPRTRKLVSEELFNRASFEFVRSFPPKDPCLHQYGEDFPIFVGVYFPTMPYLKEIADIEWAMKKAYHSADAIPYDPTLLNGLDEGQYASLTFEFSAGTFFQKCHYDLSPFWSEGIENLTQKDLPKEIPSFCMVYRESYRVIVEWLSEDVFSFLKEISKQKTLEEAFETAASINPKFDLSKALQGAFLKQYFAK